MKVNYVLLYGTPYLKYELFDTFEKMSDFIIKRSIVNYTIFEKMEDKKEVEMIYRDSDIHILEKENERLNNIINEFDKWLLGEKMLFYRGSDDERLIRYCETKNKWLELKEGK